MCGLFGFFVKNPSGVTLEQKTQLMEALGWKSEARGKDSWGVLVRFGRNYRVHRGLGAFKGRANKKHLTDDMRDGIFIAGHTRQATHGGVLIRNAHPFECGPFIMSHNGVIDDADYKASTSVLPKGETDSETFLSYVVGEDLGVNGFLTVKGWGGSAFQVYNKLTDDLYLVNVGRDLSYIEDDNIVVWASASETVKSSYKMVFHKKQAPTLITEIKAELYKVSNRGLKLMRSQPLPSRTYYSSGYAMEYYKGRWVTKWEKDRLIREDKEREEEAARQLSKEESKEGKTPVVPMEVIEPDEPPTDDKKEEGGAGINPDTGQVQIPELNLGKP